MYHSLINQALSDKLESVQKLAMNIIFGNRPYKQLIENGTIELLSSRMEKAVIEFAKKTTSNDRFAEHWFDLP